MRRGEVCVCLKPFAEVSVSKSGVNVVRGCASALGGDRVGRFDNQIFSQRSVMSSFRTGQVGRWVCVFALAGLLYGPNVRADFVGLLNVDFGEASPTFNGVPSVTYSGAAVVGSAGDIWNGPQVPFPFGGHQSAGGLRLANSAAPLPRATPGYHVT